MILFKSFENEFLAQSLKKGKVGVLPTDTIYGLTASALSKQPVERIFKLKKRNKGKPPIVIISSLKDLSRFSIKLDKETKRILNKLWPNKISIILPYKGKRFEYLSRKTKGIAFRLPKHKKLVKLLKKTGPLITTSANIEGKPHARNIKEALGYFKGKIDFYLDKGELKSLPSTLISIENSKISVLRQGAVKIPKYLTKF